MLLQNTLRCLGEPEIHDITRPIISRYTRAVSEHLSKMTGWGNRMPGGEHDPYCFKTLSYRIYMKTSLASKGEGWKPLRWNNIISGLLL